MTAQLMEEPSAHSQGLLDGFLRMETPEGFRAELLEGVITVVPPPCGVHEEITADIGEQVFANSSVRMRSYANKGLHLSCADRVSPKDHVIPDLVVAPRALRLFYPQPSWASPEGVEMVVEVTSENAQRDRVVKSRAYARAGIPCYFLVDRRARTVTLLSAPDEGAAAYTVTHTVSFGESLELPEPFSFALDTTEFD